VEEHSVHWWFHHPYLSGLWRVTPGITSSKDLSSAASPHRSFLSVLAGCRLAVHRWRTDGIDLAAVGCFALMDAQQEERVKTYLGV
jgi:hypothetical protein